MIGAMGVCTRIFQIRLNPNVLLVLQCKVQVANCPCSLLKSLSEPSAGGTLVRLQCRCGFLKSFDSGLLHDKRLSCWSGELRSHNE